MAANSALTEVSTLLAANWTHTPIRSFGTNINSPVPSDSSSFAELTFPIEPTEEMISFGDPGNNVYREYGAFRFCLLAHATEYVPDWLDKIDALRDVLRNHRSTDGHFRIYEAPSPYISDTSDREGYRELSIAIPYEFDIFR